MEVTLIWFGVHNSLSKWDILHIVDQEGIKTLILEKGGCNLKTKSETIELDEVALDGYSWGCISAT